MSTRIVPVEWRSHMARQFIDSLVTARSTYYLWIGNHIPISVTPIIGDDTHDTSVDIYNNMILGKLVQSTDVRQVIKNIPYVANVVYARYDDGDPLLYTKSFYVTVDDGAGGNKHVFKCLDNASGNVSSVSPSFSHVDAADDFYQTSDGYVWKYMFSIDQYTYDRFCTTSTFFPVVANTAVISSATPGSIDIISVDSPGSLYNNYLDSTFTNDDLRVDGNPLIYRISGNTTVSTTSGFYTGCILYVATGVGAGQYRTITNYNVNSNGNFMTVASEFFPVPQNGSQYQIRPNVTIVGDGRQTVNAVARALINPAGNGVSQVQVLVPGLGYSFATANVVANAVVNVASSAVLRPISGPVGGHGADPVVELGSTSVAVTVFLANTEANTLPATNGFRQIGLMHDPMFANVQITVSNPVGSFLPGETVSRFETTFLQSNVTATAIWLDLSNANFDQQLDTGDYVFLASSDGIFQALEQVNAVSNNSHVILSNPISWACTSTLVYKADISANAHIDSVSAANTIVVSNVATLLAIGDNLVGNVSGATGTVLTIKRNDTRKDFTTFVQMPSYKGTIGSGAFIQNEAVYQGATLANSTANAFLHSTNTAGGSTTMYVTNLIGNFNPLVTVKGANSQATFSITNSYASEIVPRSGKVTYAENTTMYSRSNSAWQSLTLKLDF